MPIAGDVMGCAKILPCFPQRPPIPFAQRAFTLSSLTVHRSLYVIGWAGNRRSTYDRRSRPQMLTKAARYLCIAFRCEIVTWEAVLSLAMLTLQI